MIPTNGMVTPDVNVLKKCREIGAVISVSDYIESLPKLEEKISDLEGSAQEAGVTITRKRWNWVDPGRFDVDSHSINCTQVHMQLTGGKLWRCSLMASGHNAGFCAADSKLDYMELPFTHSDVHNFLNFDSSERTSQCKNCLYPQGVPIPSAEQEMNGEELC